MAERTLGALLFPAVEELDLVGPWELFGFWHEKRDGPRCLTVGTEAGPIQARHGLRIEPDVLMADAPSLTYLLVPGGPGTRVAAQTPAIQRFVARQAANADAVLSVCTGIRLLRAADLLRGRRVTTHHAALDEVRGWPEVTVAEERYVQDGSLWTAAGVSAGLDMALAFIAAEAGGDAAARVQRAAEYFPEGRRYDEGTDANAPGV